MPSGMPNKREKRPALAAVLQPFEPATKPTIPIRPFYSVYRDNDHRQTSRDRRDSYQGMPSGMPNKRERDSYQGTPSGVPNKREKNRL
jgi:hypothetical protein